MEYRHGFGKYPESLIGVESANRRFTSLMKQFWQWVSALLLLAVLPVFGQSEDDKSQAGAPQAEEMTSAPIGSGNGAEAERVRGLIGENREKLEAARQRNLELAERRARLERRLAELRRELKKSDQLRDQILDSASAPEAAEAVAQPGEKQSKGQPGTAVSPQ